MRTVRAATPSRRRDSASSALELRMVLDVLKACPSIVPPYYGYAVDRRTDSHYVTFAYDSTLSVRARVPESCVPQIFRALRRRLL